MAFKAINSKRVGGVKKEGFFGGSSKRLGLDDHGKPIDARP